MHKLTKITPLIREEIFNKYKEKMKITKGKNKEEYYEELAGFYRVHYNTIRKIILRGKNGDFTIHKSTIKANQGHKIKKVFKVEKKIQRKLNRDKIVRYEKEMAGEDDATRMSYTETLPNKKAKTLSEFLKRAYKWFKNKGVTIKKLLSDNGLEFTTHHISSRKYHSFEIMLEKLKIIHKYTRIRKPQTNGKIERFWRIFEEQFFRKYEFLSNKDFNLKLMDWLVFYNTKRKHGGIKYITPMQKLENLLEKNLVCL